MLIYYSHKKSHWEYSFAESFEELELTPNLKDYETNLSQKEKEFLKSGINSCGEPIAIAKLRVALKDLL